VCKVLSLREENGEVVADVGITRPNGGSGAEVFTPEIEHRDVINCETIKRILSVYPSQAEYTSAPGQRGGDDFHLAGTVAWPAGPVGKAS